MKAVWVWMRCQRCEGSFLLPNGSLLCVHCERVVYLGVEDTLRRLDEPEVSEPPEVAASTLAVAFAARRAHRAAERATAELNRTATAMADVLCADDLPWSTDEPMPDLRHLWETERIVRTRPRYEGGTRGYKAWNEPGRVR